MQLLLHSFPARLGVLYAKGSVTTRAVSLQSSRPRSMRRAHTHPHPRNAWPALAWMGLVPGGPWMANWSNHCLTEYFLKWFFISFVWSTITLCTAVLIRGIFFFRLMLFLVVHESYPSRHSFARLHGFLMVKCCLSCTVSIRSSSVLSNGFLLLYTFLLLCQFADTDSVLNLFLIIVACSDANL